ncbi:glycosyl transferase, group 1 [Caldicellulosiruptor saccharolyticus DSM 8903]|uniref:Glycosyl transferase, group 1 n=1 Tax=Caldicellulosiruptor saccharolyticus (strain ATCC 43494 / DSM 8903 / Tp8T 6331) TaxID=351627 RepID=A4XMK8_CALS8|nr:MULTISPECIES: glycosyltransferase family 1 protein [Caldicellulosiruptor]ABP68143.1 glycosyl transferase, group 1 [Caldicellulosiruptor saccharolyticus DSM 8903]
MNIGVDARPLGKIKTGIGFYLYNLLKVLPEKCSDINFFLFSDREISLDFNYPNVKTVVESDYKLLKGTLWYMQKMDYLIKKYNIDVFWGTQNILPFIRNKNVIKILTVHDLVCYKYPQTMERLNYFINRVFIPYSIKSADKIVAVSNSTKEDILNYFNVDPKKICVIYNPVIVCDVESINETEYLSKHNLEKNRYILYVGTIEPRKNTEILLKICKDIYAKTGMPTVLAGKIGWKSDKIIESIKEYSKTGCLKYLEYISDIEKNLLMRNCFIFVFPSFYEGFGLPVVEALKNGALVLVSDTSSLKELITIDELKFDPLDCKQLSEKIINFYVDNEAYTKYRKKCNELSSRFENNQIIEKYVKLFYNLKDGAK